VININGQETEIMSSLSLLVRNEPNSLGPFE